jgi:hypothetical protein
LVILLILQAVNEAHKACKILKEIYPFVFERIFSPVFIGGKVGHFIESL